MTFADITPDLKSAMPDLRGRLNPNVSLAEVTWFRVGGPAQALFSPADQDDLSYFLTQLPSDVPVTVLGLASNTIVRDGGVPGVTIRLGRGFSEIEVLDGHRIRVGTAVPDVKLARAAADAEIDGLAFFRGIPGALGGALRMNAGAYGGETKDVLIEATGVMRSGEVRVMRNADFNFRYRGSDAPDDIVFTSALFQGRPGTRDDIAGQMDAITSSREATQPVKSRTGGSTFKNPEGGKSWQLIDAAGCRGLTRGAAQVSELHCNFLLNLGGATAADIEGLGEEVRRRVEETSGVRLSWEIKRIGLASDPSREGADA